MTTLVFLHIPKTAGQTVHNVLVPVVGGKENVSPIRVHTQVNKGALQMPQGYRLYSGHLDWNELNDLPSDRFVFTVLREPRERIASFYLYLKKEAEALNKDELALPQNIGKRRILEMTADEYFTDGDNHWKRFIADHYDNFYCCYFATRRIRGASEVAGLSQDDLIHAALQGAKDIDEIYTVDSLGCLEDDIETRTGHRVKMTKVFHNSGPIPHSENRWQKLMSLISQEATRTKLESFCAKDDILMRKLESRIRSS